MEMGIRLTHLEAQEQGFEFVTLSEFCVLTKYIGKEEIVEVPQFIGGSRVATVGRGCFEDTIVKKVTIPFGVTIIQDYAFSRTQLEELRLAPSVIMVGRLFADLPKSCELFISNYSINVFKTAVESNYRVNIVHASLRAILTSDETILYHDTGNIAQSYICYGEDSGSNKLLLSTNDLDFITETKSTPVIWWDSYNESIIYNGAESKYVWKIVDTLISNYLKKKLTTQAVLGLANASSPKLEFNPGSKK